MPFDWREFLIVAHELRNDGREGVRRTCIGRAYYYVFNLGLKTARQRHWPEPSRSVHSALWGWCQKQSDANIKMLGILGSRMHSLRIDSDYKDTPLSDSQAVHKQLQRARDFEIKAAHSNGVQPPAALAL